MAKQKTTFETKNERQPDGQLAGQLWLEYYNRTLYEKGLITRQERDRMSLKISGWKMIPS